MSPCGVLRHVLCASNSLNAIQEQVTVTLHPFIDFFVNLSRNQSVGSEKSWASLEMCVLRDTTGWEGDSQKLRLWSGSVQRARDSCSLFGWCFVHRDSSS
jgi:hypothetical protein